MITNLWLQSYHLANLLSKPNISMKNQTKKINLGTDRISRLLLRFALPSIASLVLSSLYTITDQIFVGQSSVGVIGTSAIGIVFPLLVICLAFAYWLGDGCAAFLSISQGKKEKDQPSKAIAASLTLALVFSILLMIVYFFFSQPILSLFGASEVTLKPAQDYLFILTFFIPSYLIGTMASPIIRSDGTPTYALITIAVGAGLNLLLDPLFIYVLDLGIQGAAWATGIALTSNLILSLLYFLKPKTFSLKGSYFLPKFQSLKVVLRLGFSSFITQMSIVIISLASDLAVLRFGPLSIYGIDIPIAAIAIESKIFTIVANIVVGISVGSQPIIGYSIGSGDIKRVKKTYFLALIWTMSISLLATLFCELFPKEIMSWFGRSDDPLYWEYGVILLRVFLATIVMANFMKLSCIFFQSCGHSTPASIISGCRDLFAFIPFLYILPTITENINPGSGITSLLFACVIADLVGFIASLIYTIHLFKKLNQLSLEKEVVIKELEA